MKNNICKYSETPIDRSGDVDLIGLKILSEN